MKIMRVEGSSGGGAVLHAGNHVQRVHLHLSGLLPVKSSSICRESSASKINTYDGSLIYKIIEQFPKEKTFKWEALKLAH